MKKTIGMLLCLTLLLCGAGFAEEEATADDAITMQAICEANSFATLTAKYALVGGTSSIMPPTAQKRIPNTLAMDKMAKSFLKIPMATANISLARIAPMSSTRIPTSSPYACSWTRRNWRPTKLPTSA